jgi:multidrug/hemolysin transport system permease protein
MNIFAKRNLKLFFRDRSAVFFSLMAILIIIVLYAAFLGDVWLPDSMEGLEGIDSLMDSWLVSGLLAVASVTTMGAFGVMIDDRVKKINRDFCASPFPKSRITAGYLGSVFLIGTIMSVITFAAAELYIVLRGGDWLGPVPCLKMLLLLIFLPTMANTAVVCFIVSFFKSQHALSTASTIIGTAIGFVSGIYLPIGSLQSSVQTVIKLFPVSYSASLFRKILMEAPLKLSFDGVSAQFLSDFREYMGVTYQFGGHEISALVSILILVWTAVIFYVLSVLNLSKQK